MALQHKYDVNAKWIIADIPLPPESSFSYSRSRRKLLLVKRTKINTHLPFKITNVWLWMKWGIFFPWKEVSNFWALKFFSKKTNLRAGSRVKLLQKKKKKKNCKAILFEVVKWYKTSSHVISLNRYHLLLSNMG